MKNVSKYSSMKQVGRYHKFLRTTMVITAFMLIFDSGMVSPITRHLSDTTMIYLANVGSGVNATVEPNEYNTLAAQLAEQKQALDAREAELAREIPNRFLDLTTQGYSTYILSVILFLQTTLIVGNYVLDYIHLRQARRYEQKFS